MKEKLIIGIVSMGMLFSKQPILNQKEIVNDKKEVLEIEMFIEEVNNLFEKNVTIKKVNEEIQRRKEEEVKKNEEKARKLEEKKRMKEEAKKNNRAQKTKSKLVNQGLLTKSNLTSNDIDKILKNSNMEGLGSAFLKAEEDTGINAKFLTSLAILESGWGTSPIALNKNNIFGYGSFNDDPYNKSLYFNNFEESIKVVSRHLKEEYLTEGGKHFNGYNLQDVNIKYCLNDDKTVDYKWSKQIKSIMNQF